MKKITGLLLLMALCLNLVACGGSNNAEKKDTNPEEKNGTNLEKETLDLLNEAFKHADLGMFYILRAWDFGIKNASANRAKVYTLWDAFAKHMSMSDEEIKDAILFGLLFPETKIDDGKNSLNNVIFMQANLTVRISQYHYNKQTEALNITKMLDKIKENLKTIDDKSESYKLLKEYYLMVAEMEDWIANVDGNYLDSSKAHAEYKKKAENLKKELELTITP